jgi:hypothetical protein
VLIRLRLRSALTDPDPKHNFVGPKNAKLRLSYRIPPPSCAELATLGGDGAEGIHVEVGAGEGAGLAEVVLHVALLAADVVGAEDPGAVIVTRPVLLCTGGLLVCGIALDIKKGK